MPHHRQTHSFTICNERQGRVAFTYIAGQTRVFSQGARKSRFSGEIYSPNAIEEHFEVLLLLLFSQAVVERNQKDKLSNTVSSVWLLNKDPNRGLQGYNERSQGGNVGRQACWVFFECTGLLPTLEKVSGLYFLFFLQTVWLKLLRNTPLRHFWGLDTQACIAINMPSIKP